MIGTCGKKILLSSKQVLFVTEVFSMESALSALVDEVAGVKLGDKRLTKRLAIIIDRLGAQPNPCIPAAMHVRNETEAVEYGYAFQRITKSTPEHLGDAQCNRPPLPAKHHGFSPPFTIASSRQKMKNCRALVTAICLHRSLRHRLC